MIEKKRWGLEKALSSKIPIKVHGVSCLLAVAMLLTFAKEGNVSQVFLQDVNLEGLVHVSDAVLVVSKKSPDITFKDVPIDTTGKLPPHKRRQYRFDVVKVLINWSEVKDLKEGPITVMQANDEDQYQALKDHYLGLPPKSPVYFSYKSGIRYDQITGPFIVFLKARFDGQFELTVPDAFESIKKKAVVSKLIAKQSRIPPPRQ